MTAFVEAVKAQRTLTENGMDAFKSTMDANVDMFFKIGAMRGQDPRSVFEAALAEDAILALRVALWARDARGGAGERKLFRDMIELLDEVHPDKLTAILHKIPELGRWDDLLVVKSSTNRPLVVEMIRSALNEKNGLCAKWMPRESASNDEKRRQARVLRKELGLNASSYRKMLSTLSNTVEQQMCARDWEGINFSHVPSLAAARYKNAFLKRAPAAYQSYLDALARGDNTVKVNSGAVYPYDVLKDVKSGKAQQLIRSQWEALPNFVGNARILPMVDVSGSMETLIGPNLSAMDVSISLGLYLADKNTGVFKDAVLSFSSNPSLFYFPGDIITKYNRMQKERQFLGYSTNLAGAFDHLLKVAKAAKVPQEEMPEYLLVLSDMQFNAYSFGFTAVDMIRKQYAEAGYEMPRLVFWNLHDRGNNIPARFDENGTALVSGFSPSIMKAVLKGSLNPRDTMLDAVMDPRYDFV